MESKEASSIFQNSDFIYLLNQGDQDKGIVANALHISKLQLSFVTNFGEGEGLIIYGGVILPFVDKFPTDNELYGLLTTRFNEVVMK